MKHLLFVALFALACCTPMHGSQAYIPATDTANDTPGGMVGKHNTAAQPILFVATGGKQSTITVYSATGEPIQRLSVPKGIVVQGGMTMDAASTLYAVTGWFGPGNTNDAATVYAFGQPYAIAATIGVAATALVDDPVDLCSVNPGSLYVVNEGAQNITGTASALFSDPASGWTVNTLPSTEQFGFNQGTGQDQYGDCFFPAAHSVQEYTGGTNYAANVRYRGNALAEHDLRHRFIAVGPSTLYVADNREIQAYSIAGPGAIPTRAYIIHSPWAEGNDHIGGLFSRMATDGNGVLYSAHASMFKCGFRECAKVAGIDEYRPGEATPFRRFRLPGTCFPGPDCLADMSVSGDGHLFLRLGDFTIAEYAPGAREPITTITTSAVITSLYAVH